KTKQWVAVEALCRWTAPNGEKISPCEFIRMAEQLGLIRRLEAWVRKTALTQCVSLGLDKKKFMLNINFSSTQRINDELVTELLQTLAETGFPASKLTLEITESTKMVFDEESVRGLQRLASEGITLSLDDFGTGYSTFENLFQLSVALLKTEKLILDGIEQDNDRQYVMHTLADLAGHLNMQLIVEGVETHAQFELLGNYNINYAQGYLFSRPLSFEQIKEKIGLFGCCL
ncbi:EAL domain-containing protein, partial [Christensenellaceae bacterium OttesenSCG-928-K19]|nr:EAL domain-containing protein [Christensenellaceae bacterium OttesenSCG-928-K19]